MRSRKIALLLISVCGSATVMFGVPKHANIYRSGEKMASSYSRSRTFVGEKPVKGLVSKIIDEGKKFLGRPYLSKSPAGGRFDCSGFVSYIFSCFDIDLPRSSRAMYSQSQRVKNAQPGDLLFFKGSNRRSSRVGHVALVVDVDGNQITMMHSCNRGIVVEKLNGKKYYESRLLGIGRVGELQKRIKKSDNEQFRGVPMNVQAVLRHLDDSKISDPGDYDEAGE
ncbi:C40 family peptidase [Falsiporphyromonas endometrii]|uniref:C40 family peptidase n=1 Tax=Falsiporphyromonas endometrii TaxID=1387297 RepID=A0ABV9K5B7_9PORP